MEPDLDKIASTKIRQAELRPTRWNKEAVWQNVMSETGQTRRNYPFNYSAAAVVLLLLLFGVHQFKNDRETQFTHVNNKSQEQRSGPRKKSVQPEMTDNNMTGAIDPRAENNEPGTMMKIRQHVSNNVSSMEREEQAVNPIVEPIIADLEITEEEFLLPEEETIQEQKIRPIVGIITESYSGDVAKVKRKKSLHKLESLEPVPWESVPNALVFARKK